MNSLMLIEMIAHSELMKRKSRALMTTTAAMEKMAMAVMVVATVVMAVTTVRQLNN